MAVGLEGMCEYGAIWEVGYPQTKFRNLLDVKDERRLQNNFQLSSPTNMIGHIGWD